MEEAKATLFVIASRDELPWASELTRADCSGVLGTVPPRPPVSPCEYLHDLIWKVPPRPRGMIPPVGDAFDDGSVRIPAIVSANAGAPYTAIEWQFKPRK